MGLVPRVTGKSTAEVEAEAEGVMRRFDPRRISEPSALDVISYWEFLEDSKINRHIVTEVVELPDEMEGRTFPNGTVQISVETYEGAVRGVPRCRFTIPHEGYHGLFHAPQLQRALVDSRGVALHRRANIPAYEDPEWQANMFSAATLMPGGAVRKLLAGARPGSWSWKVQDMFQVSYTAANKRIERLLKRGVLDHPK